MADGGGDVFNLPTDAFVEVLLRLSATSRRLLRLVCKRRRGVIDERIPEPHVTPKILAVFGGTGGSSAVVFSGDQQDGGRAVQEWTFSRSGVIHLVGTCNGLLCLRNESRWLCEPRISNSAITVVNPITGERTMVAPKFLTSWAVHKYSFGYHPTTGKYKVVDIACFSSPYDHTGRLAIDAVRVFTLGEESWREVPTALIVPDLSFQDSGGLVNVDGTTHWLTAGADCVKALDLEHERVASFEVPPVLQMTEKGTTCQLTNVDERLGVVVMHRQSSATRVDVWVLDGGGHRRRQRRWSQRCSLLDPSSPDGGRWITSPHFTHHGEYVLSKREVGREIWLYRHRVGDLMNDDSGKNAQPWPLNRKEIMYRRREYFEDGGVLTFPFVETMEPVPICPLLAGCSRGAHSHRPDMGVFLE